MIKKKKKDTFQAYFIKQHISNNSFLKLNINMATGGFLSAYSTWASHPAAGQFVEHLLV